MTRSIYYTYDNYEQKLELLLVSNYFPFFLLNQEHEMGGTAWIKFIICIHDIILVLKLMQCYHALCLNIAEKFFSKNFYYAVLCSRMYTNFKLATHGQDSFQF